MEYADGLPADVERAGGATETAMRTRPRSVHERGTIAVLTLRLNRARNGGAKVCEWCKSRHDVRAMQKQSDHRFYAWCNRCRAEARGEATPAPVERRRMTLAERHERQKVFDRLFGIPRPPVGPGSPGIRPSAYQVALARYLSRQ